MKKVQLAAALLALAMAVTACGASGSKTSEESAASSESTSVSETASTSETASSEEVSTSSEIPAAEAQEIGLHRHYTAAHGEQSFARVVVAMSGEKIVGVALDEFQYMAADSASGVPNSDADFGKGAVEGKVLASKRVNTESYSALMAEKAQSTVSIDANYDAIQSFAVGKTVAELEKVISSAEAGKPVEAVSGATLVDTVGYLQAIVDAAKDETMAARGVTANPEKLVLTTAYGAPHGTKSFADAVVAQADGVVAAASIDEFQYFAGTGVPNSDAKFGENYADAAAPLASKLVNSEAYSALMTEKAKSTTSIADNFTAIGTFAVGKTAAELSEVVAKNEAGKPVEAVSGATLVDTVGYLQLVVDALK